MYIPYLSNGTSSGGENSSKTVPCSQGYEIMRTGCSGHILRAVDLIPANITYPLFSVQFSLVAQSCPALCDSMNHSTPGLPVHHQLPEFTQTHIHRVGDAIKPSHPVVPFSSCPRSLPASGSFPMSQLFT